MSGGKVTTQKARAGSTGRRESTRVKGEQVGGEMCKGSGGGALSSIKFVRFWFLQPHGFDDSPCRSPAPHVQTAPF